MSWADERSAESTFSGALSDDGQLVAFLSGQQTVADPNLLYIAKTDVGDGNITPIYNPQLLDDTTSTQDEPSNCHSNFDKPILILVALILYQIRESII